MSGEPAPLGAAPTFGSCVPVATSVPPWQVTQVSVEVSTAPFTCRPPATLTTPAALTVPPWQLAQVVSAAALWWLAVVGGDLWQLPQSAATRLFQDQEATLPRVVVAFSEEPWQ